MTMKELQSGGPGLDTHLLESDTQYVYQGEGFQLEHGPKKLWSIHLKWVPLN